jgi:hypothetical protein
MMFSGHIGSNLFEGTVYLHKYPLLQEFLSKAMYHCDLNRGRARVYDHC